MAPPIRPTTVLSMTCAIILRTGSPAGQALDKAAQYFQRTTDRLTHFTRNRRATLSLNGLP